ncbi:hypothetical protein ACVMAJ_006922 [Bradyrhizobium sp. USDA 4448]
MFAIQIEITNVVERAPRPQPSELQVLLRALTGWNGPPDERVRSVLNEARAAVGAALAGLTGTSRPGIIPRPITKPVARESSPLDAAFAELRAEKDRLAAIVEGRMDRCQARAAFPLDLYGDRQVRRLCDKAYSAKMRGEPYPFDCWKEGEKGIWWCEKSSVDRYLQSIGVAPVDFHKVMLAQSKSRNESAHLSANERGCPQMAGPFIADR